MKNFIVKRIINIFEVFLISIIFLSCPNENRIYDKNCKVNVSISINSILRTIFPQVSLDDVASYKLLGGINSTSETILAEFTSVGTSLSLEPGIWNFTLDVYNSSGDHILQGKVQNQQISMTGNNQIIFSLSVLNNGTGTIQIKFNYPIAAGISRIVINGDIDYEESPSPNSGEFIYIKEQIATGEYLLNFNLYSGNILRVVISELVFVRSNLTSSKNITLVGDDLKHVLSGEVYINPDNSVSVGMEITAIYSGEEIVTWQWNKDGFVIPDANEMKYIPNSTGYYTVTVGAATYDSKTSESIVVINSPSTVPGDTLNAKLVWLANIAESYGNYILDISVDETIPYFDLSYSDKSNISITLKGNNTNPSISILSGNTMFDIGSSVTLILDNNITLQGQNNASTTLINLKGGSFVMNAGSALINGRVVISSNSNFTMNGGNISGYKASSRTSYGGGVYMSGGNFIMNDGVISNNGFSSSLSYSDLYGGGVYMSGGNFIMNDGIISNNGTFISFSSRLYGGGVSISGGNFIMNNGTISNNGTFSTDNPSSSYGGGVFISGGNFIMNNGFISDNNNVSTSFYSWDYKSYGSGVYINSAGFFYMYDGIISNNNANNGGGVYNLGNFILHSGIISDNTAQSEGGGVFGTITMNGGTIFDNTASNGGGISGNITMHDGIISNNIADNGGGVYGNITMHGGTISDNNATYGGGVSGNVTMHNGIISNNIADNGGGVYGSITMNDGTIYNNTVTNGGGVYVSTGSFNMIGGIISKNTATSNGGAIYLPSARVFNKTGGTIFGYTPGFDNSNVVKDNTDIIQANRGHAVYVNYTIISILKETNAGPEIDLLWNGTTTPPTFSGGWDY